MPFLNLAETVTMDTEGFARFPNMPPLKVTEVVDENSIRHIALTIKTSTNEEVNLATTETPA